MSSILVSRHVHINFFMTPEYKSYIICYLFSNISQMSINYRYYAPFLYVNNKATLVAYSICIQRGPGSIWIALSKPKLKMQYIISNIIAHQSYEHKPVDILDPGLPFGLGTCSKCNSFGPLCVFHWLLLYYIYESLISQS